MVFMHSIVHPARRKGFLVISETASISLQPAHLSAPNSDKPTSNAESILSFQD
jgi:hypothetical protein